MDTMTELAPITLPAHALELGMQELDDLEAPGIGDIVSWVGGGLAGGGLTYYISVATIAAT